MSQIKFDEIGEFNNGLAVVNINDKYGVINENGDLIVEPIYDEIDGFYNDMSVVWLRSGGCKYINKYGDELPTRVYDVASAFYNDFAIVGLRLLCRTNKGVAYKIKYGAINKDGDEIIEIIYDSIEELDDGGAMISLDGSFGIINSQGKLITPIKYDSIGYFSDNMIQVCMDHKYGFVRADNGEEVIPPIYDEASDYFNGLSLARLGDKWGVINISGESIMPFDFDDAFYNGSNAFISVDDKYINISNMGKKLKKDGIIPE